MKKLTLVAALSIMLSSSVFAITALEKLFLPEFKEDLSTVSYKVVETTSDDVVINIDGKLYIIKNK